MFGESFACAGVKSLPLSVVATERTTVIMVDCSRNAIMKVDTVKRFIDSLSKMGYNMLMLYTEETYEEKDDLGLVSKIITTSEEALLKCGLLTWNGTTLQKLIDRCTVSEDGGKRTIKIGGANNAQGKYYAICFFHEDKADGNVWILIKGKNTAGATLTFAADAGTVLEPEFKAMPQPDGTLVELVEEIGTGA